MTVQIDIVIYNERIKVTFKSSADKIDGLELSTNTLKKYFN